MSKYGYDRLRGIKVTAGTVVLVCLIFYIVVAALCSLLLEWD